MIYKYGYTVLLMITMLFGLALDGFSGEAKLKGNQFSDNLKIIWQLPVEEKELTVIPGSLKTEIGAFEFRWIIGNEGASRLVTLESSGSGELPPREKRIFLWIRAKDSTLLFQEWFPLVNVKEPRTIRPLVNVATSNLFSVLPKVKLPPISKENQQIRPIVWGKNYCKNNTSYLPGLLKTSIGKLNICWKKEADHIPELITIESLGKGELLPREFGLYLWIDKARDTTMIYQERKSEFKQGITSYLWPLARVKTIELISGFDLLNKE